MILRSLCLSSCCCSASPTSSPCLCPTVSSWVEPLGRTDHQVAYLWPEPPEQDWCRWWWVWPPGWWGGARGCGLWGGRWPRLRPCHLPASQTGTSHYELSCAPSVFGEPGECHHHKVFSYIQCHQLTCGRHTNDLVSGFLDCLLGSSVELRTPTISGTCRGLTHVSSVSDSRSARSVSRLMESLPAGSRGQFSGIISREPVGDMSWWLERKLVPLSRSMSVLTPR